MSCENDYAMKLLRSLVQCFWDEPTNLQEINRCFVTEESSENNLFFIGILFNKGYVDVDLGYLFPIVTVTEKGKEAGLPTTVNLNN